MSMLFHFADAILLCNAPVGVPGSVFPLFPQPAANDKITSAGSPNIAGTRHFRHGIQNVREANDSRTSPNAMLPPVPLGGIPMCGWTRFLALCLAKSPRRI